MVILHVKLMEKRTDHCEDNLAALKARCYTYYDDCRLKCCTGDWWFTLFSSYDLTEQDIANYFINAIGSYKHVLFTNYVYNQTFICGPNVYSMKRIIDNLLNTYPENVAISDTCQLEVGIPYEPPTHLDGTSIKLKLDDYWKEIFVNAEGASWGCKGVSRSPDSSQFRADICIMNEYGTSIQCINAIKGEIRIFSNGYRIQITEVGDIGYTTAYAVVIVSAPCIPNWICEIDTDGNNTGWASDGCGNRKQDVSICPIPVICTPIWICELDPNGDNTGWIIDGCDNREYNTTYCPLEKPCTPDWKCEIDKYGKNTGYLIDDCGNREYDPTTCPLEKACIPEWRCEIGTDGKKTGYLIDGCGNREYDPVTCPPEEICVPEWICVTDSNNNNTGWAKDGCGHSTYDTVMCPIEKACVPIWKCEIGTDGKNTGMATDGCGGIRYDTIMCPVGEITPPPSPEDTTRYIILLIILAILTILSYGTKFAKLR